MRRQEALDILGAYQAELRGMGVLSIALFGSVARDEAGPESDVDILVDVERPMGLFRFLDIKLFLETRLGRPVDLVTRQALKQQYRDRILAELVDAA